MQRENQEHDKREERNGQGRKKGSPCFLWAAVIEKQHRIFDRHEAIICPLLYAAVARLVNSFGGVQ